LTSHVSSVFSRQNDAEVRNLFSKIEKLKGSFESVERPTLDIEQCKAKLPAKERSESSSPPVLPKDVQREFGKVKLVQAPTSLKDAPEETLDPDSELAKLELEFGKVNKYPEETSGWDFDELEEEL
jgi:hypothetical protein